MDTQCSSRCLLWLTAGIGGCGEAPLFPIHEHDIEMGGGAGGGGIFLVTTSGFLPAARTTVVGHHVVSGAMAWDQQQE
jgi:hypothetical protein